MEIRRTNFNLIVCSSQEWTHYGVMLDVLLHTHPVQAVLNHSRSLDIYVCNLSSVIVLYCSMLDYTVFLTM